MEGPRKSLRTTGRPMPVFRAPSTARGQLALHVLAYNGARLLFVCVAAGVLLAVDALTSLDISFVLVLLGALAASLPLSALTLRKLRRTINADIEAVDRTRSIKKRGPAAGRPGTDKP
ncbi:DUF4229 domain-containing protein [Rhodococcus sp. 05-2255-1e]|nr:DUF4229 domain-containing protein [Rhodococcus fascians]OZC94848.1 DUF4229 domain-containing protein [Rhodococcus sp. 06-235-1A]OZD64732.1 DUF4229 domain-containing protein [Rhodococcus sp. 05-340-2]OZD71670.1 DUF4229 domain-containing protein [Rhodococcus sp. 05-340-1]OZE24028.1 DUF4229 domain-containing protein [Rhodococcus sp. 05-2255-1e]OZE37297.1 DUF4229 domain-containing protein [Rhodococcus sp. 05-2254-4]OZE45040.1 DUF4229 domain-containing protein [Rhodococcus sp. 05-2254-3]OZE454